MQKRTYLTITRDNKKDAIRAAGRLPSGGYPLEYDRSEKLWFAVADADLEKVKAWLPAHTVTDLNRTITDNLTPAEEFAQVLKDAGFILPGNELPEMDGKRHRVATEDDKPGATSGVYQGFLDGRPAGWYQDHRASEGKVNWTSTGSHTYDPAEAIKQRALAAQKRWDREMQSQVEFTQIGKKLTQQWSKMPPRRRHTLTFPAREYRRQKGSGWISTTTWSFPCVTAVETYEPCSTSSLTVPRT